MTSVCGTGTGNITKPDDPNLNDSVVSAVPAFGGIDVSWTYPGVNPNAVAYTELYRSTNSDPTTAVRIRIVSGDYYYDKSSDVSTTFYYWIKIVSINGTVGTLLGPASATARPTIEQVIAGLSGQIANSQLGLDLKNQLAKIGSLETGLTSETTNRQSDYQTVSNLLSQTQTSVNNINTLIGQETQARKTADSAQVTSINAIGAKADNNNALIVTEQKARADGDTALSTTLQSVQTTVGNHTSTIQTQQTSINGLKAKYTVKLDANGLIGGFGIYDNSKTIDAGFNVSNFWIGNGTNKTYPFIVNTTTGEVYINDAVIEKLTFDKLRAADGSLIVSNGRIKANYLQANTLVSGTLVGGQPAFAFNANGSFQLNGSNTSGSMHQDSNQILVKDSAGTVRVKIGAL